MTSVGAATASTAYNDSVVRPYMYVLIPLVSRAKARDYFTQLLGDVVKALRFEDNAFGQRTFACAF